MTPVPYVPEEHFEQVRQWMRAWDEDLTPDVLPQTGFILPGKAAGFLYRTDSAVAWIENIVAAPGLRRQERGEAVDAIVAAVCQEAQRLGFRMLLGYTQLEAIVERARRFGFAHVPGAFQLVALRLR